MSPVPTGPKHRLVQLGWFVGLWVAGLVTVSAIAYVIRAVIL